MTTGPEFPFCAGPAAVALVRSSLSGTLTTVAATGSRTEGAFQTGLASGSNNTISAVIPADGTASANGSGYIVVRIDGTPLFGRELPQPCIDVPGAGPGAGGFGFWIASGIARGSDGAFYVTVSPPCAGIPGAPPNAVLRIDASGTVTNTYNVPDAQRIAEGPDGNLWITQNGATNGIARLSPSGGFITEFAIPTANAGPLGITAGNDGAVWFTENTASKIARITVDGTITEFPTPTPGAGPYGIGSLLGQCGPGHGLVWFTENTANKVGRLEF